MRKVTKILGMIGSAAILLLILLPIILSIVVSLPPIQNRIIHRATQFASEYLNTKVSISKIDVTMRGGLELSDVLICDLQLDTMIYVKRLESQITQLPILSRRVALGNTAIEGGEVNLVNRLNEDGSAEMNIRQITQLLTPKDRSKQPVVVDVSNVVIDGVTVRIQQLTKKNPPFGVDMRDLEIQNISASISHLTVDGPALHTYVNRLSGVEKSGFDIYDIAGELYITEGALSILDMSLMSRWSNLDIKHLLLANESWRNYREFNTSTLVDIDITSGNISSDDLSYFAPSMRNWGIDLRNIKLSAIGEVADLNVEVSNISYGEDTHLNAALKIVGLPDINQSNFNLTLGEFKSSAIDLDQLTWSFTNRGFNESTFSKIEALGDMELTGEAEGTMQEISLKGALYSDAGEVSTQISIERKEQLLLDGWVDVKGLKMGLIEPKSGIGDLTMMIDVNGVVDGAKSDVKIHSEVESVAWSRYTLRDITLSGEVQNGGIDSIQIVSRDPLLDFNLRGGSRNIFNTKTPNYNIEMGINRVDFGLLGINRRDSISQLSGSVEIFGMGDDLEECWSKIYLRDGVYIQNRDTLNMDEIAILLDSKEGDRSATLRSEYANIEFNSRDRVRDIIDYFKGVMVRYMPAIYDNPQSVREGMDRMALNSQDGMSTTLDTLTCSKISVQMDRLNPLINRLTDGLKIGDGSKAELLFDINSQEVDLTVSTPYFERGTTLAIDLLAKVNGRGDSLLLNSNIRELLVGTSFIEKSSLEATLFNNQIDIKAQFANKVDSAYADIGANIIVGRDRQGEREIDMVLLPSYINRRNQEWKLHSRAIKINSQGFDINNFKVESRNQMMVINGRASTHKRDTMRMELRNFDLSIFSTLISQLGYQIEGRTNGEAIVSSVLDSRSIEALVELDSVSVNTLQAPPMLLRAEWDSKRNRARLHLTNRQSCDTLIRGFYIPSEVKYYAQLDVDSLKMAMLDPPLGGVITDTEGTADLSLTLQGTRRNANLNGTITAHNFSTTVDYIKSRYHIPRAVIEVHNNMLRSNGIAINDGSQGSGSLSLEVDLQHLSNIGYKLHIAHQKLRVLNTKELDNDTFYGELFASGVTDIQGNKSGVKMNIVARTDNNSKFFMPLANKANISTAEFITFAKPNLIDTTSIIQMRRMLMESHAKSRGAGNMEIDMALDVRSNTELQLVIDPTVGDIIRARGTGQINLNIEPKSNIFEIYGDYTIDEGNYLFTLRNIVNKRFVIDPGSSIKWTGAPMDPTLDINAIYQLKTSLQPLITDESSRAVPVDCIIKLSDHLTQPDVEFAIDLPSADPEQMSIITSMLNDQETISRQFFYLMLANSFIPETSSSSDLGVSTTTATGFELLTNQLSNWLSSSNYNIIIRYRPESELTGDEVDFGFSRGLINNRLLLELEGNYIIDNKQAYSEDASNFMGEAYVTWLIDRAGALRLKGFTQTIDRYDENQGLQETGMGIYYRENFNNFRDLQQRVKARFKASDERIERREAREIERQEAKQREIQRKEEEEN